MRLPQKASLVLSHKLSADLAVLILCSAVGINWSQHLCRAAIVHLQPTTLLSPTQLFSYHTYTQQLMYQLESPCAAIEKEAAGTCRGDGEAGITINQLTVKTLP